ncbi:MAG: wax ester/triacylglycerol synthase family O-acyltransferase [Pseudomonadota bacterium]
MEQLSGLDASFLYMETTNTPMHIGSLCIYDQSTAPGGMVRFKDILAFYEERLHRTKVFRRRLARVPMSLDHPYWIEDPDFDLEFHVRHIALPRPGDWRQLCIQTARLHARAMDLNRPLWEVYVIEGLDAVQGVPKGSFAVVTKVHHAAIDGVSGSEMGAALHDLSPDADVAPPARDWVAEREPTDVELFARTGARVATAPSRAYRLIKSAVPAIGRLTGGLVSKELHRPPPVPRTRFNGQVSSHRVFDARTFSLDEIRAIKRVHNVSVNDVIVAVCGGALRAYLEAKYELPEESLVAMAPMSTRAQGAEAGGNQVATLSLPVGSNIEDPVERVMAVHEASTNAKKMTYAMGPELLVGAAEFLPSTTSGMLMRGFARMRLAETIPPVFNTVITNVPGPNVPLFSMGSKMVANYGLGPAVHGIGLFQPVLSYNNQITISAISCREMMPDPAFYMECLQQSYDAMKAASLNEKPALKAVPTKKDAPDKKKKAAATKKKAATKKAPKATKE